MENSEIRQLSLNNITEYIKNKKLSCLQIMEAFLENVSKHNDKVNAIAHIDTHQCLNEAKKADEDLKNGIYRGVLHGVPIGVKDNYKTTNYPTTVCSNVLKDAKKDSEDAKVIETLKSHGAIVMAKTNMHEWAFGATNEISNIGAAKNPWNEEYITGGSSGGSGAGIATDMFPCALGSDTGGSIRIPSAGCGISGIKPTYGLLNKSGVYPLSFSLDVVGPMARSAEALSILLKAMIEPNKLQGIDYNKDINNFEGLRFGVPKGLNFERNADVDKAFREAIKTFKELGAIVEEIEIPYMKEGLGAWKAILYSEATTYHQENLKNYRKYFGENIRVMLESGESIRAVEYIKAYQFRYLFIEMINKIFSKYNALLFTTLPVTPPKIGDGNIQLLDKYISSQNSMTYLAWLANYAGTPQVSIPCGFGDNNLPIGLAIMSKAMNDFNLLAISKCFQLHTNYHTLRPSFLSIAKK